MQWIVHTLATVIPLGFIVYWLWFRNAWYKSMLRKGKQGGKDTIAIYPTVASLLRLEAAVVVPVSRVTKVIITARCIIFYAGPCKIAELWLLAGQSSELAEGIHEYCSHATVSYVPYYPRQTLAESCRFQRYYGMDVVSFNDGQYFGPAGRVVSQLLESPLPEEPDEDDIDTVQTIWSDWRDRLL